jgi:hypothetical protein
MDIHPTGDHVLLGSLDRRVAWFDMDLASTPYKTLRYHTKAIRCALFHRQVSTYYTMLSTTANSILATSIKHTSTVVISCRWTSYALSIYLAVLSACVLRSRAQSR